MNEQKYSGEQESEFWAHAALNVPRSYRWLGRSLPLSKLDALLSAHPDWIRVRASIRDGDQICPFEVGRHTMAMRRGYVIIRQKRALGGIVVESS